MEQQRPAEACGRYREALALKLSPGLLNAVGLCLVQEGDALGALQTFERSLRLAEQQPAGAKRDAWEQLARQELVRLEPRVGRLDLRLPELAGLSVHLDGKPLAEGVTSVAVSPGQHQLEVTAPERSPHRARLQVAAGVRLAVEVPTLAPVSRLDQPPLLAKVAAEQRSASRTLEWLLVGVGSAALVAGVATGTAAAAKDRELERNCANPGCPDDTWQSKIDSANTLADVTNVFWGVGLAALGVGITLFLVEEDAPASAEVHAACHAGRCGLLLDGRF